MTHYPSLHTYLPSLLYTQRGGCPEPCTHYASQIPSIVITSPKRLDKSGQLESRQINQATTFQQNAWDRQ
jgi:hypothetical protein